MNYLFIIWPPTARQDGKQVRAQEATSEQLVLPGLAGLLRRIS